MSLTALDCLFASTPLFKYHHTMDSLFAGQGQLDEGSSSGGGILPSNDSYRPTQGAIRHSEDTEL